MGTFSVQMSVSGPTGESIEVEALVDTGSTYAVLPSDVLDRLGVGRLERRPFKLADDSIREYDVGEAIAHLDGRQRTMLVVFGGDEAKPLLGAVTLGSFGLGVDPVEQRLVPVPGVLKQLGFAFEGNVGGGHANLPRSMA